MQRAYLATARSDEHRAATRINRTEHRSSRGAAIQNGCGASGPAYSAFGSAKSDVIEIRLAIGTPGKEHEAVGLARKVVLKIGALHESRMAHDAAGHSLREAADAATIVSDRLTGN